MSYCLLNGKQLADKRAVVLAQKINAKVNAGYRAPSLAVIIVGDDPASVLYVNKKKCAAEKAGIKSMVYSLEKYLSEAELIALIRGLNQDNAVDGILIQMPLPSHINKHIIIETIDPQKDVDGLHPYNMGRLAQGRPAIRPCTSYGIITLLNDYKINVHGLKSVVIGASLLVGRPMALELIMAGSTVTVCHSKTSQKQLDEVLSTADIIISAVGKQNLVTAQYIKTGAIIIDVGIHRNNGNKITGDLDFEQLSQKAKFITPVPGGVGPMTVMMLLENTFQIYMNLQHKEEVKNGL